MFFYVQGTLRKKRGGKFDRHVSYYEYDTVTLNVNDG